MPDSSSSASFVDRPYRILVVDDVPEAVKQDVDTGFLYHVAHDWPQRMVLWLRRLGGKLGLASDLDGPNILLAGISAVFVAATTLSFAAHHPFPRAGGTCG